ncbi:protein translocase subunit SecF [Vibrio rhizosphaerae]|uniref:Protein-export membrane protein SecF n=1 Tax=Vibrio rhizosphaerae TaxID=398736 RepID=A0ABU4IT62_9VIBR|nr:protein translocase subunit SecF [Vibrio rhizosphaerae]MDW6092591.1 protein translocase subunit SecF [Vibrio rhizosphaerae]
MTFKFTRYWRYIFSAVSVLLMVLSIGVIALKGLNWGQDFTGGVVSEIRLDKPMDESVLRNTLTQNYGRDVSLIATGEPKRWILRYPVTEQLHIAALSAQLGTPIETLNTSIVGPQVGQELAEQGGLAVLIAVLCILGYLSFRFEWRLASGALFALIHDVVFVIAFFALTQMEFNLTVLAAVLAILGYSLNDSIIIADRIRELLIRKPDVPLPEINNMAVMATFSRTMVTSGTTLMTVAALWIMGGEPLQGFSIAMFIGILTGTFSSIAVGTSLPELLGLTSQHYQPQPVMPDHETEVPY